MDHGLLCIAGKLDCDAMYLLFALAKSAMCRAIVHTYRL